MIELRDNPASMKSLNSNNRQKTKGGSCKAQHNRFFCNDLKSRMDKIMALRKEINATYEKEGVKLSVNDFVIKAVALACKRVPECNSAWMETFIR